MSEMHHTVIPYESLDPLTIGSADDDALVYRDTIELSFPLKNLMADIRPDEPEPAASTVEAARHALRNPQSGPPFADLIKGGKSVAVIIDNQFRPTPQSKILPAVFDEIGRAHV